MAPNSMITKKTPARSWKSSGRARNNVMGNCTMAKTGEVCSTAAVFVTLAALELQGPPVGGVEAHGLVAVVGHAQPFCLTVNESATSFRRGTLERYSLSEARRSRT